MVSLQDAQLQQLADEFLAKTKDMSVRPEEFDAAYEWLSDSIPDFAEFEQVCMFLGLA
jgi:hypothetical protein